MTPARVALLALSSATIAARAIARRRGAGRPRPPEAPRDVPSRAETERRPPAPMPAAPPRVPWMAAHAERFMAALVVLALAVAGASVVAAILDRLPSAWQGMPLGSTLVALTLTGIYLMWKVP